MGFARRVLIDDDRMVAEGAAFGRASELILSALLADEGRSPMNAMGSILWIVDEDGEEEEEGRLSLRLVMAAILATSPGGTLTPPGFPGWGLW